ncbi:hypothetical protein DRH29_05315 [candidate division Kazan bacterium]|uniref:Uncharacterized protein n=1 Tax=candidate division Kazan bacterium TaxID=2202143 RepID=A0A420ZB65_UNCK3|nr:MAG: hypothetical protein DRH29_05315 [candidate division Kazan bacterium]
MPIPKPHKNEKEKEFISRCIKELKEIDKNRPIDQIVAICYSQYKKYKREENMENEIQNIIELCPKGHPGGRGRGSANFPGGKTMWERYFKWAIKHDSTKGLLNFHRYLVMIYKNKTGKNITAENIELEGDPDDYAEIIDIKDAPQWVKDIEDKLPPQAQNPYSEQDILTVDDWVIEELRRRFKAAGKEFKGKSIREMLKNTETIVTGDFIRLEGKARYKHKLLNIGKKNYHGQEWNVTKEYMEQLIKNTKKYLDLGLEIPLTISHPRTQKDFTTNKVGKLIDLEFDGTWLWGIFEVVDPEAVKKIEDGVWDRVSIGITEYPMDTLLGEKIDPPYVDHVAITSVAALPDQGTFIKLEQQITKLLENIKGLLGFKKEVEQEAPQDSKKQEEENNMDEKNTKQLEEIKKLRAELEKARKELSERRRKEFEARVEKYIKEKKLTPAVKEDVILLFDYLEKKTDVITLENDKELTVLDLFVKVLDNLPKIDYIEGQKIANPLQAKELSKEDKEKIARKLAGVE